MKIINEKKIASKSLFLVVQFFIIAIFLIKYFNFFSNQQIWYDDAHELLIGNIPFSDTKSFLRIADHHIGYSIFIKLLVQFIELDSIYLFLGILNLLIFFLISYFIGMRNNYELEVVVAQTIFLISPIFIDYIYRPKQYFLDFCIAVLLIEYFKSKNLDNFSKLIFLAVACIFYSNILIVYFVYPILKNIFKNKNYLLSVAVSITLFPIIWNSTNKLFDQSFRDYWGIFYDFGFDSIFKLFYNNLLLIRSFNDLGYIYLVIIILGFGIFEIYKNDKNLFYSLSTPYILLSILNIFNLYPIGAGRTDLILFPVFYYSFMYFIKYLKIYFNYNLLFIFLIFSSITLFSYTENKLVREDNTFQILSQIEDNNYDHLYVSFYSIPQVILFDRSLAVAEKDDIDCFYRSANRQVTLLRTPPSPISCEIETDLSPILNDAKDGRFVIVIGHDSKTQNIEKYIMDNVREYSRVSITKFGKDELLIKINSNT